MKKFRIIFFLFFILTEQKAICQYWHPAHINSKCKEKVKNIEVLYERFENTHGVLDTTNYMTMIELDKFQNIIGRKFYDSDCILRESRTYKYNPKNQKKEDIQNSHESNGKISFTSLDVFSYDKKGRLVSRESKILNSKKQENSEVRKYSRLGFIIDVEIFDSTGHMEKRGVYEFDEQHRMVVIKNSNSEFIKKYNKKGKQILLKRFTNGEFDHSMAWEYDKKGRESEFISIYSDEYISKYKNLNLKEYSKNVVEYDKNGLVISMYEYDRFDTLLNKTEVRYDLDKNGNWIKSKTFLNDRLVQIAFRYIEYFK